MRTWPRVLALLPLLLAIVPSAAVAELTITKGMHHLRSGAEREWAEFPERAEGAELVQPFDAQPNQGEQTLRLRHRDLRQQWRVLLNGTEIAKLPLDESDMRTHWAVPAGTLRAGRNELRIVCAGRVSDDVSVGEVVLIDRPRDRVLSEATVDVSVRERPSNRAVPSRITVTDPHGTLVSLGNESGPNEAVRTGVVYTADGKVRLRLPTGRYVVYAGRGFEYSVARAEITLTAGANPPRQLTIRREVDTVGWAAMDTHVHTGTFARHGDASVAERMLTIAGEGVELPVSTEHDQRVDFEAHAGAAGVRAYFTPLLGSEVTTPAHGHFNVFAMPVDGPAVDQRAPGWAPLGESIARAAGEPVIVLNHGRDNHGGFRPLGTARHISVAGEDLDGWTLPANAMEVINSGAVATDGLALARDWMGLLNRGQKITPVGSSDSHDVTRFIVGQGRTYVRCNDSDPGRMDLAEVRSAVRRGQVMVSYGLLAELDVETKGPGEVVTPGGELVVRIRVKGPGWTRAENVALYVNGVKFREEKVASGGKAGLKWEGTWRLPRPVHDVHLVAIASGPGVSAPYWPTAKPYQPTSIAFTPYVLGISGAVFVDGDSNGRFDSAFDYARLAVSAAEGQRGLVAKLASYDSAVATQAASLLRARDPAGFEARILSMIRVTPPLVTHGLQAYLDAWKESQAALERGRLK